MNYQYLVQVGAQYDAEEEPSHRAPFLDSIAAGFRDICMRLGTAEAAAANPASFGGSVRERATAFGNIIQTRADAEKLVRDRRASVRRCEAVIERMGARVDANGRIDWGQSYRTFAYNRILAAQGMTRVRFHSGRLFMDNAHFYIDRLRTYSLYEPSVSTADFGSGRWVVQGR
jgi:hypothetical protein